MATITEGDFLRYGEQYYLKNHNLDIRDNVLTIPRQMEYAPVSANANMEDLITRCMNQNFVPVIDDKGKFIGIITRKDIIQYTYKQMK